MADEDDKFLGVKKETWGKVTKVGLALVAVGLIAALL